MEGRSPEFLENPIEKTDDGFSEAKSAKAIEGKGMDSKQVKKRKPAPAGSVRIVRPVRLPRPVRDHRIVQQPSVISPELSQKQRIVHAYKENSQKIVSLVELLNTIDGANIRQEEQIIAEIKERRHLQEELLNALILEQRHQLTEESISKKAWSLII